MIYIILILSVISKLPEKLKLSSSLLHTETTKNFTSQNNSNTFLIKLEDSKIIKKKKFFIIFESENPGFTISFYNSSIANTKNNSSIILDIKTYSGNIVLAMSDTYFNTKFLFFKNSNELLFKINNYSGIGSNDYKIKVLIADRLKLNIDKIYTTRIDYMINNLGIDYEYNSENYDFDEIKKIRFQLTAVMFKEKYSMSANLKDFNGNNYKMNNIFQNIVGGILEDSTIPICKKKNCLYEMDVFLINLKVVNIETFFIKKIEDLSIMHYDDYYDRVYKKNKVQNYRLKYHKQMENLDISISLIPVNGNTNLYINPKTKKKDIDFYYYKQKGNLSKRITIKNEDLIAMKAEKSDLYIAVSSEKAGEYMLRIDAHDKGYRGRLSSGILEAGFVKFNEIANYIYIFDVYRTQEISFDVKLNVISGNANLFLKKCESLIGCKVDKIEDLAKSSDNLVFKKDNDHVLKEINHKFECQAVKKHKLSHCRFLIVVVGKEDIGTHYEISLQENRFHRLITPGHLMNLSLLPMEKKYIKFSFPSVHNDNSELYLSIENIWGSFSIYIDKEDQFPGPEAYRLKFDFHSQKAGLFNSLKEIKIDPRDFSEDSLQGKYFITIEALTSSSLNLKFYEKNQNKLTIHSLTAGVQQKAKILNNKEIIYYTIKVSLGEKKANSVIIDLNPLKGRFIIFASRAGYLPLKTKNDIISNNHRLELFYKDYDKEDQEYIIGVQSAENDDFGGASQFSIFLSYSDKFVKLNPGVLSSHTIHEKEKQNFFLIEILNDMDNLLLVKSIVDGYNLKLCAKFGDESNEIINSKCDGDLDDQKVGLFYEKEEINTFCKQQVKNGDKCYMQILVRGFPNQKFSIGFTYNDLPFEIVKETIINGPIVQKVGYKINFIYHAEIGKPINFYFNSKGHKVRILSKLVNANDFDTKLSLTFPNAADYDESNMMHQGHIYDIFYDASTVQAIGENPEVLLTIIPEKNEKKENNEKKEDENKIFKKQGTFILQTSLNTQEISRTHVHSKYLLEQNYEYFNFYNNGLSDKITIYINSNDASFLEAIISKNRFSRPPYDCKPIKKANGVNSIILEITKDDLKSINDENGEIKGYFTIGVKSNISTTVHIYWNNKDNLDYIELTPFIPIVTNIKKDKNMYFSFYVDSEDLKKEKIILHLKSDKKTDFYIISSKKDFLEIPDDKNYNYKKIIPENGGVTNIEINPKDKNYCTDCTYIIFVKTEEDSQISILVNIEHQDNFLTIKPGFPIYDSLDEYKENKQRKYRFLNTKKERVFFSISMLSGYVNIYFNDNKDISTTVYKNQYFLEHDLDVHKYIEIDKKTYGLDFNKDLYFLIENPKNDKASYMINIYQHGSLVPIEKGITKYFGLGHKDEINFFFEKKDNEKDFEIILKLRKIINKGQVENVLAGFKKIVKVFLLTDEKNNVEIEIKNKYLNDNVLYIEFELTQNSNQKFKINIKNDFKTILGLSLDLLINNYKLLHINEPMIDYITNENEKKIYEFTTVKDKFIYVKLESCLGKETLEFSTSYNSIKNPENSKNGSNSENSTKIGFETIKDIDNNLHYLKTPGSQTFLSIKNTGNKNIYKIVVYNQGSMEDNPYNEFEGGNSGLVDVFTDSNSLKFKGIEIKKIGTKNFIHKIVYKIYLSEDLKVMKFLKNCGTHRIEKGFKNPQYFYYEKVVILENDDIKANLDQIEILLTNLESNKKYYGIVIADINLLPKKYSVEPVRFSKIYYDEFIFKNSRIYYFNMNYILIIILCLGFFFAIVNIINIYVFGGVKNLNGFKGILDFRGLKKDCLEDDVRGILEYKLDDYRRDVGGEKFDLDGKEVEVEMGDVTKM